MALRFGNDSADENHARLWRPIASCECHLFDPQRNLTSVLAKIGHLKAHCDKTPPEELKQFLPDEWKTSGTAEPSPEKP